MLVNKLFTYLTCAYLKTSTYYVHMRTKILADFQVCNSAPLKQVAKYEKLGKYYQYYTRCRRIKTKNRMKQSGGLQLLPAIKR